MRDVWHRWIGIIGRQRQKYLVCLRMNLEKPVLSPGSKGRVSDFIMISDGLFHFAHIPCMPSAE